MKRILLLALALGLLISAPAAAATVEDVDGALGVSLGWFQVDDETETYATIGTAGLDFDAALSFGLDYSWYVDEGTRAWNLAFLYSKPDVATTGAVAGWTGDATVWQLSLNHLWYVSTQDAGPNKGWYLGTGLGYGSVDVSLANAAGTTVSADDSTLDINALVGYEWACGGHADLLWVVDESNLGLSMGYRF